MAKINRALISGFWASNAVLFFPEQKHTENVKWWQINLLNRKDSKMDRKRLLYKYDSLASERFGCYLVLWTRVPQCPPPPNTHIVTNLLSGVGCTLDPPTSPSNWHVGMKESENKEHPYMFSLEPGPPSLPKCVLTPAIGIKKVTLRCS